MNTFVLLDPAIPPPGPWCQQGACRGKDPRLFFRDGKVAPAARALCHSCPVRAACLEYALRYDVIGTWAGTSRQQRRRIRQAKRVS